MRTSSIRKAYRNLFTGLLLLGSLSAAAQKDTLRLMTYNTLYYGDGPPCQAPHNVLHGYLKTIINYVRPDVLALVKVAAPVADDNRFATAPRNFPDSILRYALNAARPDVYNYCPYSNDGHSNNIELLFYNQQKLGFAAVVSSYVNITDFNTYKLYYKSPTLEATHDTVFLYVTVNHDKSGDEFEDVRGQQIRAALQNLRLHFTRFPNMISMGDFNTRSSNEQPYTALVFPKDSAFRFFDPPFYDGDLTYPADWDNDRASFGPYLTTSTRRDDGVPNPCGTAGGAKNWYDHIFLSSWIVNNLNHIRYIPHSYHTVGNDGNRYKIAINEPGNTNASAPPEVIEALYQFSNKYPVMADLEISPNVLGATLPSPEIAATEAGIKEEVTVLKAEPKKLTLHFTAGMMGEEVNVECLGADGKQQFKKNFVVKDSEETVSCKLEPGVYDILFSTRHSFVSKTRITLQ